MKLNIIKIALHFDGKYAWAKPKDFRFCSSLGAPEFILQFPLRVNSFSMFYGPLASFPALTGGGKRQFFFSIFFFKNIFGKKREKGLNNFQSPKIKKMCV